MMNEFEYIEMYATKEQLEELRQIKQKVNKVWAEINHANNLNSDEYHFILKSLESYICDPFIDLDGVSFR